MGCVTVRVRSQVLFAESTPGLMRLDGALLESAGADFPAGSLVSIVLRMPVSEVVASVVEATVNRWAEEIGEVDLELVPGVEHSRVVLSDGASTVRLEVETTTPPPASLSGRVLTATSNPTLNGVTLGNASKPNLTVNGNLFVSNGITLANGAVVSKDAGIWYWNSTGTQTRSGRVARANVVHQTTANRLARIGPIMNDRKWNIDCGATRTGTNPSLEPNDTGTFMASSLRRHEYKRCASRPCRSAYALSC